MGWLYGWKSKEALVKELTEGAVKFKLVGNHLWTIRWYGCEENKPYIVLFLLSKSGGAYGYKALSESEGPFYYSCPLSFLAEVPVARPWWREKVREWHREKEIKKALKKLVA
jgi:hypothetical protein